MATTSTSTPAPPPPATTPLPREILHQIFGADFTNTFVTEQQRNRDSAGPKSAPAGVAAALSLSPTDPANKPKGKSVQALKNSSIGHVLATSAHHKPAKITPPANSKSGSGPSKPAPKLTADHPHVLSPAELLSTHIEHALQSLIESNPTLVTHEHQLDGRLGPSIVKYDFGTHVGSFIMSSDRLGLNSQSNFGSIRANVCVFKGKWQYEVQLGTCGVMQIGWATLNTKFTTEKGVGDTSDSYGYDGNRLRKWNFTTSTYGNEIWKGGDIIGCCIDMDQYTIEFFRNGVSLGLAFSDIHHGPGIAYFPATSLTYSENIVANFGASPFLFPILNHEPIQSSKIAQDSKSVLLLTWLDQILAIYPPSGSQPAGTSPADYQSLLLITNRLFQHLEPNVDSAFVIEHTLLPFAARQFGLPPNITHHDVVTFNPAPTDKLHLLLDLMWTYLEDTVMKTILERFAIILMSYVKSNTFSFAYPYQVYSIQMLIGLVQHRRTRRHFIHHLLFDKTKITNFLYVRPIDEDVLKTVIATPWWTGKTLDNAPEALAYEIGCNVIQDKISHLENLQVELLKVLLTNTDGTEKRPSSRALFLRMMRNYLYETLRPGSLVLHPISKPMCTFFRILKVIAVVWTEEIGQTSTNSLPLLPNLPPAQFYDTTIEYFDLERVGGSANHLYKLHHVEVAEGLHVPDYYTPRPIVRNADFYRQHALFQHPMRFEDDATDAGGAGIHEDTPFPSIFGLLPGTAGGGAAAGGTGPGGVHSAPFIAITAPTPTTTRAHAITAPPSVAVAAPLAAVPISLVPSLIDLSEPTGTSTAPVGTRVEIGVGQGQGPGSSGPLQFVGLFPNMANLLLPLLAPSTTPISLPPEANEDDTSNVDSLSINSDTSSNTSFGDRRSQNSSRFGGNALMAETASGHNMLIPMFAEFRNFLSPDLAMSLFPGNFFGFGNLGRQVRPLNPRAEELGRTKGVMDPQTSLRELLDDTILIYSAGVSHHVEKVVALRASIEEYITAVAEAKRRLAAAKMTPGQKVEIVRSIEIFTAKLNEQSRHMAWLKSAVFTIERQGLIVSLLTNLLASLKEASTLGLLFRFTPDVYVTILVQLTMFLLNQMHPTVSYQKIQGFRALFRDVAEFVALHFTDTRIVLPETKDTLTQALNAFVCDREMLRAIEDMPEASQATMVKSLLRPYENRAWAQSNWMLVRIWQGNGFGFQYLNCASARKSFRSRGAQDEYGISTTLPPSPSPSLQAHMARLLVGNQTMATSFVHSVLNQLNWAFSEFVGLLQEINAAAAASEHIYIDSRQLKVCCTCFELTQALLRVVEMIVTVAAPVLTDPARESGRSLLERLCMLLSQILNRIACNSGTFGQVLDLEIAGLETITYYAMLASVAGILIALIAPELKMTDNTKLPITRTIVLEPSMQISCLDFLIGERPSEHQHPHGTFSLRNYVPEDLNPIEIQKLEATIQHLKSWSTKFEAETETISDDDICTICYAYPKTTTFHPCKHRACRSCIIHHLLNRGECFFCKSLIEKVVADDGVVIHDIHAARADVAGGGIDHGPGAGGARNGAVLGRPL